MGTISFPATTVARSLAKFTHDQLDQLEFIVDMRTHTASLEVVGLRYARAFLTERGLLEGKHWDNKSALTVAGEAILEFELEKEDAKS